MTPDYSMLPSRSVGRSLYSAVAAFPVSCFILTFLTDLAYWATDSVLWETISVWLLAVGSLGAGLAVLAGLIDFWRSRTVRGLAQPWPRVIGQLVALGLSIVNLLVHCRDGYTAVVPQGLILSGLVVVVLLATAVRGRPDSRRALAGGMA